MNTPDPDHLDTDITFPRLNGSKTCDVILTREGDRCVGEVWHEGPHTLDLTTHSPRKAVDGA